MRAARARNLAAIAAAVALVSPLGAPQLLAFPYSVRSHGSVVWSETPLSQPALERVLARTTALVAQSPLAERRGETRHIFLTDGGWRWTWLALQSRGGFALSRGFTGTIVVNRSNLAEDRVISGARYSVDGVGVGGRRTLSGTLAHEFCHEMEQRRFGPFIDLTKPTWLREGYCDYVAQESSLSDADVALLRSHSTNHPALPYYEGRRRVSSILDRNEGNVDALFTEN